MGMVRLVTDKDNSIIGLFDLSMKEKVTKDNGQKTKKYLKFIEL